MNFMEYQAEFTIRQATSNFSYVEAKLTGSVDDAISLTEYLSRVFDNGEPVKKEPLPEIPEPRQEDYKVCIHDNFTTKTSQKSGKEYRVCNACGAMNFGFKWNTKEDLQNYDRGKNQ